MGERSTPTRRCIRRPVAPHGCVCAAAGCAFLRATCRATCESEARGGWAREAARRRACTCVRCGRGGGSPAVCAEVVHAAGDARWARRPPQATAFRGEGDGEGGVEGGWRGRRRRRCRSSRWHQDCRRHSGGDDRHWDAAKRESTRSTPADFAGSQAMVSAAHRIAGSERTGSGGERWRQRKAAAQQIPVQEPR